MHNHTLATHTKRLRRMRVRSSDRWRCDTRTYKKTKHQLSNGPVLKHLDTNQAPHTTQQAVLFMSSSAHPHNTSQQPYHSPSQIAELVDATHDAPLLLQRPIIARALSTWSSSKHKTSSYTRKGTPQHRTPCPTASVCVCVCVCVHVFARKTAYVHACV